MNNSELINLLALVITLFSVIVARYTLKDSMRRKWIEEVHLSLVSLISGCKRILNHDSSADDLEFMHKLSTDFWKIRMLLGNDRLERNLKDLVSSLYSIMREEINDKEKIEKANMLSDEICKLSNKLYKKSIIYS